VTRSPRARTAIGEPAGHKVKVKRQRRVKAHT
jgi:hypothetical protein